MYDLTEAFFCAYGLHVRRMHPSLVSLKRRLILLSVNTASPRTRAGTAKVVVDVGGGTGTLLAAILAKHPSMRGILFDQAQANLHPTRARAHTRTYTRRLPLLP
jgi:ubiquinone/menaquinone biosynthesis C-methylase UbiE